MSACSYVNIICEIFCCRLAPEAAKGIVDAVKAADANVGIPATCKNGSYQHRRGVIYCMIRRRLPPQGFTGVQMAIDIPQLLPNLHRKQRLRCKMGQFGRPRILGSAENSPFCTSPGYPPCQSASVLAPYTLPSGVEVLVWANSGQSSSMTCMSSMAGTLLIVGSSSEMPSSTARSSSSALPCAAS